MSLPKAAVAIIRCLKPQPSILLIERSHSPLDPWSGHLAFPGGGRDSSDLNLLGTALRECEEEIGFKPSFQAWCGILPHAVAGHYSGREVFVAPFLFEIEERPHLNLNPREVQAVHWLEESHFVDFCRHEKSRFHPEFPEQYFLSFWVNEKRLWGFTYEQLVRYYFSIQKIDKYW